MEKTYETLEPGLQAAMDLLEWEARNEESNSSIADGKDDEVDAKTCAHYAWAYRQAIKLLQEQRSRLSAYPSMPVRLSNHLDPLSEAMLTSAIELGNKREP